MRFASHEDQNVKQIPDDMFQRRVRRGVMRWQTTLLIVCGTVSGFSAYMEFMQTISVWV